VVVQSYKLDVAKIGEGDFMFIKITNFLNKSIYGIYNLVFLLTLLVVLLVDKNIEYRRMNAVEVPNLILIIIGIVLITLSIFKVNKFQFTDRFNLKKTLLILSIILFIAQVFLVINLEFRTGWDVGIINGASNAIALNENFNMAYFQRYPNNVFMLAVFVVAKRVGMFFSIPGYGLLVIIGILITNISVYLTSLITYKVTSSKNISILTYVVAVLLIGLSPWIAIPYSDVYSLVFPMMTLYVYLHVKSSKFPSSLMWFLTFIIPFIGYLIKPQNIIVLIAIIIVEVLSLKKQNITPKNALMCLVIIGVSFGSMTALKEMAFRYTTVVPNDDVRFPMHHWVMMGLNSESNGVYAREDMEFTASFIGVEEKKEQNIKEIKNRLSEMGLGGFVEFLTRKTLTNYNDGTFTWGMEGHFYNEVLPERIPVVSSFIRSVYYNGGDLFKYFATFQQTIWITILSLCVTAGIVKSKLINKKIESVVLLSLLGATLFQLIFEARARYLFLYAPFYVLCAAFGLYKLQHWSAKKFNKRIKL